ncbi:hypothetical protein PHYBOEH_000751 [Phytophthora boehmeriae]|uniref:Uncharacterized protein n=1 Tax=Phytophthora boehmeriae TaxID=109152 RepID=A0A8T1V8L4_9STRA|nr:hypothetical protein PHYBOEH_000751 [Phytophthora boehmeriae]
MAGKKKKVGSPGAGSVEAPRRSRRQQGIAPELELNQDLDKRRYNKKRGKKIVAQDEPVSGPIVQDESKIPSRMKKSVPGSKSGSTSSQDRAAQHSSIPASEGGANLVESPTSPDILESQDQVSSDLEEKAPVHSLTVVEHSSREVIQDEPSSVQEVPRSSSVVPEHVPASSPTDQELALRESSQDGIRDPRVATPVGVDPGVGGLDAVQAKAYSVEQLRRWAQVRPGLVCPPNVVYDWSRPGPDMSSWLAAALTTSGYLSAKMMSSQDATWVNELHPVRHFLAIAQDQDENSF